MYILCKKCMKKVYIDPKENIDSIKRIKVTHNEQEFTAYGIECEHCGHMHYEYIDDDNAKQLFDEIMQLTKSIMVLNSSIVNDGNRKKKLIRTYTNRLQALKKKLTTLRGMLQQQYSGKEFYIVGKFSHKQAINFEKQKYYSE